MTKTVDRFDLFRSTRNHAVADRPPSVQCQLSFFDLLDAPVARQPVDAVCVPMQEIHGTRFHTLLEGYSRTTVVDVRKYPTFRLVASDQDRTLRSIRRTGFSYHRRHVHLAEPDDKTGEWRRMADISDFLVWLEERFEDSLNAVFLVHRQDDARILERCLTMLGRQSGRDWMFRHVADASGQRAYPE